MERINHLHLGVQHSPQNISKESSVLIQDNGSRQSTMDPYMLKENMSSFLNSDMIFTYHQDTCLAIPIQYYMQLVMNHF
jgi:hypothetical protein